MDTANSRNPFAEDGGIAIWRPSALLGTDRAIELIEAGIAKAREQDVRKLLLDTTALHGFDPPSIPTRHEFARRWGNAARSLMRLAFVARPEVIDPQRSAIVAAKNFGAHVAVFADEGRARSWLRDGT